MQYEEIVRLAQDVGLNSGRAHVAAAIAMAESGGDPSAEVHDSDDDSYGLWQINMRGSMGPDRRKRYGLPSNDALLDPRRNALVMADLSKKGGNFNAWTTYTSGKYKRFVPAGSDLAGWLQDVLPGGDTVAGIGDQAGDAVGTAVTNVAEIRQALTKTAAWVSNSDNWVRIAYVIGGGAIILVAAYGLLSSSTGTGKAVGTAVKAAKSLKGK